MLNVSTAAMVALLLYCDVIVVLYPKSIQIVDGVDRPKLAACPLDGKGVFWKSGRAHARGEPAMRFGKIFLWHASHFR